MKLGLLGLYSKEIVTQIHKRTWLRPFTVMLFMVGGVRGSPVSSLGVWRGNLGTNPLWRTIEQLQVTEQMITPKKQIVYQNTDRYKLLKYMEWLPMALNQKAGGDIS